MAKTCPHCQRISFGKSARNCHECGGVLDINPVLVTYLPDGQRTNQMIIHLNGMTETHTPEDMASFISSSVAACAYMMLEMNSPATIKEIFGAIIDDAMKQRQQKSKRAAN
jgi:hypothetical protein